MAELTFHKLTISELTQQALVLHDHQLLVELCRKYILDLHCTLWMNWIIESDKVYDDGHTESRGLTKAAEWLAKQIEAILALTATLPMSNTAPSAETPLVSDIPTKEKNDE